MNVSLLLEAAEFIERREKEMDHGYCSLAAPPSLKLNNSKRLRRSKNKLCNNSSRTTHNELEKNRRAHLRICLEKLKDLVPLGADGARHTTLGLLTKARQYIKSLENDQRKHDSQTGDLRSHNQYLKQRWEKLNSEDLINAASKRRSVSESSVLSTESSISIDDTGYGSNQSDDSDDQASVQSSGSDGGVSVYTRRLTLSEPALITTH